MFKSFTLCIAQTYRGRLKHGRHFTFKSVLNDVAVTLVSPSVVGSIADEEHPFAAHGTWLQVLIQDDFLEEMSEDLEELARCDEVIFFQPIFLFISLQQNISSAYKVAFCKILFI